MKFFTRKFIFVRMNSCLGTLSLLYILLTLIGLCPAICQCRTFNSTMTVQTNFRHPRSDNKIVTNLKNTIRDNKDVLELHLEDLNMESLPDNLAELKNLKDINLSHNAIKNVARINVLNRLPKLEILSLSQNPLKDLKGLHIKSLTNLDATSCEIEEIDHLFPTAMPNLINLNLTGNHLRSLPRMDSENLKILTLKNCSLDVIPSESFHGLTNLTYLDLRHNKIRTLPDHVFSKNHYLRHLTLAENSLINISNEWFENIRELETLDLSNNEITEISETVFVPLTALVNLDLANNRVISLPNLQTFAIQMNLSGNLLVGKNVWDLSNMTRIQRLDLSHNQLNGTCGVFKSSTLGILNLSYNSITNINARSLADLPNLSDLIIKGNKLSSEITPIIFEHNKYLANIELEENPWICNCSQLFSMYLYLASGQRTTTTSLICENPENVTGHTWWQVCRGTWKHMLITENQVEMSKNWMIAISAVFGSCLIFGTIVYIIYTLKKSRLERRTGRIEERS